MKQKDFGPKPYVLHGKEAIRQNGFFRQAVWTGCKLQMTLMCIPPCGEIGLEMHAETEQIIQIHEGKALICMGHTRCKMDIQQAVCAGDVIFVPCGTWHNLINTEQCPLKLTSIYAPPNHAQGTVHMTKADAEREHY